MIVIVIIIIIIIIIIIETLPLSYAFLYFLTPGFMETTGETLGIDGWIILEWISRKWDVGIWTGLGWYRIETGGGRL